MSSTCHHKTGPVGYIQRLEWLERMSKRYRQEQCNNCGLWAIWRLLAPPKDATGADT